MADESMRRADRLLQIIQILRRARGVVTGDALAAELEVSVRTIYRDVAELIGQRVPIEGAAGVGYLLRDGYDLPPLMFTEDELEALLIGIRIVKSWADPELGRAAADVLAKVAAVVPEHRRARIESLSLAAPASSRRPEIAIDMAMLRRWVREERKVRIEYHDLKGTRRRIGLATDDHGVLPAGLAAARLVRGAARLPRLPHRPNCADRVPARALSAGAGTTPRGLSRDHALSAGGTLRDAIAWPPTLSSIRRLEQSSVPVADWPLAQLRLKDDARFHWLLLVPRRAGIVELTDLDEADYGQLTAEILTRRPGWCRKLPGPTRPMSPTLGNLVPQLHVHVIARFRSDPAWPDPVWGHGSGPPYPPHTLAVLAERYAKAARVHFQTL